MGNAAVVMGLVLLLCVFSSTAFAATTYELQLIVSKYVFGPGENVTIIGILSNITTNSTTNTTTFVNNAEVAVSVINSTNNAVSNYTFTTNSNGTFFSRGSFNPTATVVQAPNASGTYTVLANHSSNVTARANIVVVNTRIDDILFQLPKVNFYSSENMSITLKTVQRVSDSFVSVNNVSVNVTMRHLNESVISSYSCVTSSRGTCTVNTTAPSTTGTFILESNSFVGFTNFNVVPFDVEAYMKDSSATNFKNIFTRGESGFIEVRVSFNSTTPTGIYNVTGNVADSSSSILNLTSIILNSTNGFVDKIPFTATSAMRVGLYTVMISVRKEGGDTVNITSSFQVRDWSLTFTKASRNSGFEYGYTAFVNTTVLFEAYPVERGNGTVVQNLAGNFTINLKNNLGVILGNSTVRYNASCDGKACYEFNITTLNIVGDYTLTVALNQSDDYQTADRTIKVTDITASAQPSDSESALKELFSATEFIYAALSAKNKTAGINVTNAEVAEVFYENGTRLSYSEANLSSMNFSDSTLAWAWNATTSSLVIDPPKTGGIYIISIYVNNKSASVTTRIGINPYDICTSAKGSSDTTTSDYWYQFRTSDTIYFHIKVNEAQNAAGKNLAGSNLSGFSSVYGRSSQCSFDSTKKRSINNATIVIDKVLNTQSGKTETLNATSSTCLGVDNTGGYVCTVQASDGAWDGGRHVVTFSILGDDKETYHKAGGFFEARAFYIYGYSSNWANKAASNITLNVNVYEAGNGWWTSASGLSGTAIVDSINFYGGIGEWIWPPLKMDYNVTGLNMTITNGVGSVALTANRTLTGNWPGGYYSAVIKATINSQVDYGEAWFSIRNWDAYASSVEILNSSFDTKQSINSKQNATLYVRITEAGDYVDSSGGKALGNVTIRVKKILDYSQWPPRELTAANFTSNEITVNATSPWYSNANPTTHGKYTINISSSSGRWEDGYYTVILDINNTESGYGWFNVISFYISTQPTNANGSGNVYNNKPNLPVYLNVTTTKSQKSTYSAADYINTTITEAIVRAWDQTTQSQVEFKYPDDINITPLLINGSQIINITYLRGSWPTGWYYGEIKMRENTENTTSKGWLWFSVQPFRISSSITSYNVGTRENATMSMSIYEPDYSSSIFVNGNYTVTSVQDTSWNNGVYRITNLNYTLPDTDNASRFASTFRNATTLTINPPGGKWRPGYKSGTIIVKDNLTNDTQTAWFSFRVTSFVDAVTRTSGSDIGSNTNVTVNITLTTPAGAAAAGNLSSAFYWGWPSKTRYRFLTGTCDSSTSTSCFINSSAIVTIVPPSAGWPEGYNYIYFEFTETDDATAIIESSNSAYFYVRQALTGYMYTVDDNGYWKNSFGQRENVTMFVYSLQNLSGSLISVNVTNVQIAKTTSGCWSESCRIYQNATFEVVNLTSGSFKNAARNNITSSGHVRINASGGTWELGDYAVKIFVTHQETGETGVIKDATFRVTDKSPPSITITSPTMEQIINASSILFTATTTEQAVCYLNFYDYGQYDRFYCGSSNATTQASCNATKYNNATSAYYSYASKWGSFSGGFVLTDSTSHSYNHTTVNMPVPQNFTIKVDCYDTDWNYATNATTFSLIGGLGPNATSNVTNTTPSIAISSPVNTTHTATNISLGFSILNFTASSCWYRLNANTTNVSIFGCGNVSFTASEGANNITLYANNTGGSIINSSTRFFTVNTSATLAVNVTSPANTTYTTTNISLAYSIAGGNASACWLRLNNQTNNTLSGCANTTFIAINATSNNVTVFANSSAGTIFNSSMIYFTVNTSITNATDLTITVTSPTNRSYTTANTSLNFTVNGTASACWYRLNSNTTNLTLASCANTTFTAAEGANNITLYANNSNGTVFNSSLVSFTADTVLPNVTFVSPTPANGSTVAVNYTFINVTVNEAINFIRLEFNGTNFTMSNGTPDTFSLAWFRNHTGIVSGNQSFKVYANDTSGNMGVSSVRTINVTL